VALLPYDEDSKAWWEALAERRFLVQRCECGHLRWPARAICGRCGSLEWAWHEVEPTATTASFTVTHHRFTDQPVPYTIVMGRLDVQDDILIPAAWAGAADGSDVRLGAPLRAEVVDLEDPPPGHPTALMRWAPAGARR
jgi:uncharacterized OB-fold protein